MKKMLLGLFLVLWGANTMACPTCNAKKKQQQALQTQDMGTDTATFAPVEGYKPGYYYDKTTGKWRKKKKNRPVPTTSAY